MKEEDPAVNPAANRLPPSGNGGAAPEFTGGLAPAPVRRRAGWGAAVALIAIAAAGFVAWQVFELRANVADTREEVAERLAAGDTALAEARGLSRQQQETIAGLQGKIGALEAHVAATEGQAAALEQLYQEFSRTSEDRVLAEAEQAINIAAQQLQLAGNYEAALIALQGAEARLATHDRGQLQSLRRALARDIERLSATPQVDVPGIALRLESLLERVDSLPLAFASQLDERKPPAENDSAAAPAGDRPVLEYLSALGRELWNEIRTLVRVERLDQSDPILLAPAQSTFLRENLKIRLLTARLALLARDGRTYAADLAQARGWIERFFDTRENAVQEVLAELAALQAMPIKVEQPSPTESFAALRLLQARNSGGRGSDAGASVRDGRAESPGPATSAPAAPKGSAAANPGERSGTPRPERGASSGEAPATGQGSASESTKPAGTSSGGTREQPTAPSSQPSNPPPAQPPAGEPR
ncbi:MAG: uroporphyrinogen-III C-methyltransferase [Aromatoleum sp.]|jgi:uroporphyrin-3 C-methyltransferase|uniref:uroporphyrinogen-III C-methyltransferase n=1 Tax=Aromatoleum sp. TaxID=2307007 RepID=UPI00289540AD|nr:uroporphyrinogen-III C-methyltransferase [Aromatoleum sp.]MDT3668819.1 uroporphyrinogen-III C-methyltransferase [Aromatoleum sp.]